MRCPICSHTDDKVIDSRVSKEGDSIRRRRECVKCNHRFTTYEMIMRTDVIITKKDGRREDFNPKKLRSGIRMACWKRPVSEEEVDDIVKWITLELEKTQNREVPSQYIGELAMKALYKKDDVAYVRFASVYRKFKDIDAFMDEIQTLIEKR